MEAVDYVLGYGEAERRRLERQAGHLNGLTKDVFRTAGLRGGMRVLDVGCGVGDVSMVAAELVGPTGSVIGVDRDAAGLRRATERASSAGLENVHFRIGDLMAIDDEERYDAVVGRLVLPYVPDVADFLGSMSERVVPGGLLAFVEMAISDFRCVPHVPAFSEAVRRFVETFRRSGADPEVAHSLHASFRAVGLRAELDGRVLVDPLGRAGLVGMLVESVRSVLPAMATLGVATADEVGIETLEERLVAALEKSDAVVYSPLFVTAWARVP